MRFRDEVRILSNSTSVEGRRDGEYALIVRLNKQAATMPGKLDEISRLIGSLETSVRELQRRIDENRDVQARRHADNSAALQALAEKIDLHAAAVEMIRPAVAALGLGPVIVSLHLFRVGDL